jgi:uncharacterized protein YuzE
MIQTSYDPEADVMEVRFAAPGAVYDGSQEVAPGINLLFDAAGRVMGIEIEAAEARASGAYGAASKAAAE